MKIVNRKQSLCGRLGAVLGLGLLSGLSTHPALAQHTDLTVSAAASLKDVMTAIGQDYEKKNPAVSVHFNFGSSGTLQQQIEQGAPVDIFLSAADQNMDDLAAKKLIDPTTRRVLAGNNLVLIVPQNSRLKLHSFKDVVSPAVTHIAIGGPTVPAGIRAEEVLQSWGYGHKCSLKPCVAKMCAKC